jgi:hypothetical protein
LQRSRFKSVHREGAATRSSCEASLHSPGWLGRDDEGEQWLERGRETAPSELPTRRCYGARCVAEETDMLNAHADALIDLADVLALAGQDARAELDRALAVYERKGPAAISAR